MTDANGHDGASLDVPATPPSHRPNGQFAPGNTLGKGNPHAPRVNQIRALLFSTATLEDLAEVIVKMVEQAKGGDRFARKELLDRMIGKPKETLQLTGDDGQPIIDMAQLPVFVQAVVAAQAEEKRQVTEGSK